MWPLLLLVVVAVAVVAVWNRLREADTSVGPRVRRRPDDGADVGVLYAGGLDDAGCGDSGGGSDGGGGTGGGGCD